ncbi:pentapeptide repeat-containing protein [Baaleninema simplex]|uniref:pentapeptide repeat-containing protein n=1 Tax=Baaleninema simplex TaxID=2862350 RepID=UPI0003494101|nr:pentapeptide repeat-containing protein [Baaleninema simplex]
MSDRTHDNDIPRAMQPSEETPSVARDEGGNVEVSNATLPPSDSKNNSQEDPILKPLSILDAKVADFVRWLENISLVKLAATLSEAALLFALVSYLVGIPYRRQQTINNVRKVIFDRTGQEHSQGRIEALQTLNELCVGNPGIEAKNAELSGIDLTNCYPLGYQLNWAFRMQIFQQSRGMNLSNSSLAGANLSKANLQETNLQEADLRGANLAGANLTEADLSGADLTEANLSGAILNGANLSDAILDRAVLNGAQLQRAKFSEASFVEAKALWANFQGADLYRINGRSANFNRANFDEAELYKADLSGSSLKFASLKGRTSLRETNLQNADLWGARFHAASQAKRANNWQTATLKPNWENQIAVDRLPRLRASLIKPQSDTSIFQAYELGMRRAANRRLEVWGVSSASGVESEAETIRRLIDEGTDAIVLVPEDPVVSLEAIREAYEAGIVVITVDFCFDEETAQNYVFACYNTNSVRMGYDSGEYLVRWARRNRGDRSEEPLKIGLVDAAAYDRYYPNLEGFLAAMEQSGIEWEEVAATGAILPSEVGLVEEMLRQHPEIEILWGGSNAATQLALTAVENLGLSDRVAVFGIFDLSRDNAQRLLDPTDPLQSIIDQSGVFIGYNAVKTAEAVLRGERSEYEFFPVEHRLLTQSDRDAVRELLDEANNIHSSNRIQRQLRDRNSSRIQESLSDTEERWAEIEER